MVLSGVLTKHFYHDTMFDVHQAKNDDAEYKIFKVRRSRGEETDSATTAGGTLFGRCT